jgi:hypothetical protein
MRKVLIAVGAASALLTSVAPAGATEIHLPNAGRVGCGVKGGTVGVLEPGDPTVTYNGFALDINFCLPPI